MASQGPLSSPGDSPAGSQGGPLLILSREQEFIFLKTSKTAGTSIEIALSRFCGPRDIISPISSEDEKIRRDRGYPGPQNFRHRLPDYLPRRLLHRMGVLGSKNATYHNHMNARTLRALIPPSVWESSFKFCFERNPWDRAVSYYYWVYGLEPAVPFLEYLASDRVLQLKQEGRQVYTIDDEVVVDQVYRYETLTEDLEAIRRRLDLPEAFDLPHAKGNIRKERGYRHLYDDAGRERIAELFAPEIEMMGYEF